MKIIICLLAVLMLAGCTDPLVMIPGGKLSGDIAPAPEQWTAVPDVVQLEVQPNDPYSLNIWAVVADGHLHVATREAKWVPMLAEDSDVVVRIEGQLFELTATQLNKVSDLETVGSAYTEKYAYDEPWNPETKVYRLTARR